MVSIYDKDMRVTVGRSKIEETLIGLAYSINDHLQTPLPENAGVDDFSKSFGCHSDDIQEQYFCCQALIPFPDKSPRGMRVGFLHAFETPSSLEGRLDINITNMGYEIPKELFDRVYGSLKGYLLQQGLEIVGERTMNLCKPLQLPSD